MVQGQPVRQWTMKRLMGSALLAGFVALLVLELALAQDSDPLDLTDLFDKLSAAPTEWGTGMLYALLGTVRRPDFNSPLNGAPLEYYPRLGAVAEYVRAHLKDPITLADAARVAGLERKYFSAYFRSKVGLSFTQWRRLLRINQAKELMATREASIPRVAFASGFRDVRTFERAFKHVVGVPPAVYRAAVRPESRIAT